MRLIETQTQWGNTYRRAYFANGKRVTESEFDRLRDAEMRLHAMPSMAGKTENTSYGFRTIWQSESDAFGRRDQFETLGQKRP